MSKDIVIEPNRNNVELLLASGYVDRMDKEDDPQERLELNLGDTICWAMAASAVIEDSEIEEVARLFRHYGWCGLLYWGFKKLKIERSEFEDNNRFVDFVENEERIVKEEPDWNKRGYYKSVYTLGQAKGVVPKLNEGT